MRARCRVLVLCLALLACGCSGSDAGFDGGVSTLRDKLPQELPHQRAVINVSNADRLVRVAAVPGGPAAALSPAGDLLATGDYDGTVRLWDTGDWQASRHVAGPGGAVWRVGFSPDGRLLASWGEDGLELREVSTLGSVVSVVASDSWVSAVAFSGDSRVVFVGDGRGSIESWELETGSKTGSIAAHVGHGADVHDLVFSPAGDVLVSTGNLGIVNSWSIAETRGVRAFEGHRGNVFDADFSIGSSLLATGSDDGTVAIWDAQRGSVLRQLEHQGEGFVAAFSADGSLLATPDSDSTIALWAVLDDTAAAPR